MNRRVILIADDDESDAFFMRKALGEICPDCLILDVADGQEAVDYLDGAGRYADREAYPLPDQLFLDIKMPRRSGLEVLRWLRSREELRGLRVAVLTGSQLAGDADAARELGADFFVKPVDYGSLRSIVEEYCRRLGFAA